MSISISPRSRPDSPLSDLPTNLPPPNVRKNGVMSALRVVAHHLKRHVGVGMVCAVAYFDPGNWSVDLQAGSTFGYRPMLFVLLMAGFGAIVLQTLAYRLGCVTGIDLASHCRLLLHDHPKHPRLVRRLCLYPLYALSEIAIISTDLAELLGSAIGLCLLFPSLPLWAGVVLTASDVLVFLALSGPSRNNRPVRIFEFTIVILVFAVFGCFVVLIVKVKPDWPQVFLGFLPNSSLFKSQPDAVYTAIGILGATVMPHALFLGSSLATQDRISTSAPSQDDLPSLPSQAVSRATIKRKIISHFRVSRANRVSSTKDYRTKYGMRENNSLEFVRSHISHGIADVVLSLLTVAVPINSAILVLAATVFFNRPWSSNMNSPAGLFDAHDLIKTNIGKPAALVFALALLCAGQTASITATLAGQIVSEGFIEWSISPFLRRLITRLISLVPSMIVAIAVGREGINTLLVASQVALSVVLPFVAFPLIYLTSSKVVMRVQKPPALLHPSLSPETSPLPELNQTVVTIVTCGSDPEKDKTDVTEEKVEHKSTSDAVAVDYSNGWMVKILSYVIWSIVFVANAYAIVMLAMGQTGQ